MSKARTQNLKARANYIPPRVEYQNKHSKKGLFNLGISEIWC